MDETSRFSWAARRSVAKHYLLHIGVPQQSKTENFVWPVQWSLCHIHKAAHEARLAASGNLMKKPIWSLVFGTKKY